MDELITKINELIVATKAASIPAGSRWLDADGVAAMLAFSPRYVLESLAARQDFPRPLRLDGTGHPRWLASEILAWAEATRNKPNSRIRAKRHQ